MFKFSFPFAILGVSNIFDLIEDDELLEVTLKSSLRLHKRYLDQNERKRAAKK